MASSVERVDLDGKPIKAITICMIGAGGFIGSHLCEKLMSETPHTVLAVDVYNDKIKHLLEPDSLPWSGRIQFHRINIKNDSRLEGLIKMADLTINLAAICTPADYNTRPLDTIYSNFIDALPVVKYCSENNKRIIHFSTCEVYGKTIGIYLPKDSPLRQTSGFQCLYIEGASAVLPLSIAKVTLDDQKLKAVDFRILWSSSANISKYKSYFSSPELIEFPTKVPGQNAYAYFYPPTNPIYQTSQHEKPPLLLKSHGGPTAETHGILNPSIQYWSLLLNPMSI